MKKHWLTVVEVAIATVGLLAWWWSDNIGVAAVAALLMFAFGVAKPLISARNSARTAAVTDRQFQRAESHIDQQVDPLLGGLQNVPFPPWSVVRLLKLKSVDQPMDNQLTEYSEAYAMLATQIGERGNKPTFNPILKDWLPPFVLSQIQGIVALLRDDFRGATTHFQDAIDRCPDWADAWYGVLLAEHSLGKRQHVADSIPYLNGIELSPLAPLNETEFVSLSESEREQHTASFQISMAGIGDLYAIAMMQQSRDEVSRSRAEYRDAA